MKTIILKKIFTSLLVCVIFISLLTQSVFAEAPDFETRDEISDQYKWDLTVIYPTIADFDADVKQLSEELIPMLASFNGRLNNREDILSFFITQTEALRMLFRASNYASLYRDIDLSNSTAQELYGRTQLLSQAFGEATSFMDPELALLDEAVLKEFLADPDFNDYISLILNVLNYKEHILSAREEELLASASMFTGAPMDIFTMLNYVDIHNIFEFFDKNVLGYLALGNTYAATLAAEVNKNIFLARARNYSSALEASLKSEGNIPVSVYENLLQAATGGRAANHKFVSLEKVEISMPEIWEGYISYDTATQLILSALTPLGEEYVTLVQTAFNENWIDVYPTPNKVGGAYVSNLGTPHPFVLLNHKGTPHCVSTIAHELGHALHLYYATESQPFLDTFFSIFTTEVASTINEILLFKHMIDNAQTDAERLFFLKRLITLYQNTFFRQVVIAEFEKTIYEKVEAGDTLSMEYLNSLFFEIYHKYEGENALIEEEKYNDIGATLGFNWMRYSHLYTSFYVYQYATSITAANRLASDLLENKPGAHERYFEFLQSGTRYDPITTLINAGVDMTSPDVINDFLVEYESLVNEYEQLLISEGLLDETGSSFIDDFGAIIYLSTLTLLVAAWLIYLYTRKKNEKI